MSRPRARTVGLGLAAAAVTLLVPQAAIADHTTPTAHSYTSLEAGFTQELLAVNPDGGTVAGAAFAADGDPWFTNCDSGSIYRIDLQGTAPAQGTSPLHPTTRVDSDAGCGLVNHPNGSMYSNGGVGVVRLDRETGAQIGNPGGVGGNVLGIATDPLTGNLVYVASDQSIHTVTPDLQTDAVYSAGPYSNVDGIYFEPTGTYLFMAERSGNRMIIVKRDGTVQQDVPIGAPLDGIAFKAVAPKFVLTNNTNGTMSKIAFPNDDFTAAPTITEFASGGFYGDITNVGPDGCLYNSQYSGTRFADDSTSGAGSLIRICGGFAPPPGAGEESPGAGNCADGIDNDGDSLVDTADPGCPAPTTTTTSTTTSTTSTSTTSTTRVTTTTIRAAAAANAVAAQPSFAG